MTTITLPAGFTKRSGKQIIAAAMKNGWSYDPIVDSSWCAEMLFTFGKADEVAASEKGSGTPVSIVVGVSHSGAFRYANGMVDAAGLPVYRVLHDSLGEVLEVFRLPGEYLTYVAQKKAQALLDEQRSAAAVVAKAEYLASPEYVRDRFHRDVLAGLVDAPSKMTLEFKGWASTLVSQTEDFLVAQYLKQFAQGTLELEGVVREWVADDSAEVKAVWTLDEAAKRMLVYSIGSNDATDPRTAVAFAKAQRDFAWKAGVR